MHIWETPTLLACADSNTNDMKSCLLTIFCTFETFLLHFLALFMTFLVLFVKTKIMCHMSHATFHLSLTPTATDLPLLTPPLSTVDWF